MPFSDHALAVLHRMILMIEVRQSVAPRSKPPQAPSVKQCCQRAPASAIIRSEVLTSIVPDSPIVLDRPRERAGAPVAHQKCLTDRPRSGGINYANSALFEKSLVIYDAVGCRSTERCPDNLHSRDCGCFSNALHGRPSAQQR